MAIVNPTGILDGTLGYIIPSSSSTWALTSGTTWDSLTSWNGVPVDPLIWLTDVIDRGEGGYFNLSISAQFVGDLRQFIVYVSTTGAFQGEETEYTIEEGDEYIPAFYGQYIRVAAYVYRAGVTPSLQSLRVTATTRKIDLELNDVVTSTLPTWLTVAGGGVAVQNARVLDVGRPVSHVSNAQITAHYQAPGNYVTSGYVSSGYISVGYANASDQYQFFEMINFSGITVPMIVEKNVRDIDLANRHGIAFLLQDQNGDQVDGTVDVRLRALPEQYMLNGQLLLR